MMLRDLAEDLVRLMVNKLHGQVDPVWEFEHEYIDTVLDVENMLHDKLNEISEVS